jgi:hypothetical protein
METIFICTIFGVFILLSYTIGLKNGQKIVNKEPIELPNINPVEKVKEKHIEKKQQEELDKFNSILSNIDNYDGTGAYQKEV